jgi:hypothetical protein
MHDLISDARFLVADKPQILAPELAQETNAELIRFGIWDADEQRVIYRGIIARADEFIEVWNVIVDPASGADQVETITNVVVPKEITVTDYVQPD